MLITFILLSWILSFMFLFLNHPLSFGLILLLQTILISSTLGILNNDYWFSYILFLIMIGGMLILFMYMTSVASNEKFKFSKKLTMFFIMNLTFTLIFMFLTDNFIFMMNMMNMDFIKQLNIISLHLNKYFSWPNMMIMLTLIIYLLITLIAIVKITQTKMGPLRQMKKL